VEEGISFAGSSDLIIAFRVRRIYYKRDVLQVSAHKQGGDNARCTEVGMAEAPGVLEYGGDAQINDMGFDPEAVLRPSRVVKRR